MLAPKIKCDEFSDQELIRKALEEPNCFSSLYERYEERMLRYIRHFAHIGREDAADILQEAFIHIWEHLHAYNPHLPLANWIYRIVHNQTITFLRRRKAFGKDRTVELDENSLAGTSLEEDLSNTLALEEDLLLTRQFLDQLPVHYKEVMVLRYLEDLHYDQISDILKIPEGTVATRINRAKKMLLKHSALVSQQTEH